MVYGRDRVSPKNKMATLGKGILLCTSRRCVLSNRYQALREKVSVTGIHCKIKCCASLCWEGHSTAQQASRAQGCAPSRGCRWRRSARSGCAYAALCIEGCVQIRSGGCEGAELYLAHDGAAPAAFRLLGAMPPQRRVQRCIDSNEFRPMPASAAVQSRVCAL